MEAVFPDKRCGIKIFTDCCRTCAVEGAGDASYPHGYLAAPTNDQDWSDRPIIGYDRGDHPFSSEIPGETQVAELEQNRPT